MSSSDGQCCVAFDIKSIHIGSEFEQGTDAISMAILSGESQWGSVSVGIDCFCARSLTQKAA
jgi:hypothetical protein